MKTLGIDVGSVTLKVVLLDERAQVHHASYEQHNGQPLMALLRRLEAVFRQPEMAGDIHAGVTGSGRDVVGSALGLERVNEIVAQAVAAHHFLPGTRTIIEIGGQDSKYIRLGLVTGDGEPLLLDQKMNEVCAAGTGAFVASQAARLGVAIEDFGALALEATDPASVAGRCTVFAKTDITHLRQQGTATSAIAAGICRAVVRNYMSQFIKGCRPELPITFQGGLAANPAVVQAFRELLQVSAANLVVPEQFRVTGAIGTALVVAKSTNKAPVSPAAMLDRLRSAVAGTTQELSAASTLPPLNPGIRRRKAFPTKPVSGAPTRAFLGVDVGSTSTCLALVDEAGDLIDRHYAFNTDSIFDTITRAFSGMRVRIGDGLAQIRVLSAGVTGSGRRLAAQFIGADVVRDEISAQARAAKAIWPEADTIIEIGGQDAKYIRIADGCVVDFEMNKVCSAGTGSFLQEQAARLGLKVEDLSALTFQSRRPVNLGSRCTVFMESDLVHHLHQKISPADLAAGLSYSIARNYLEKVAPGRPFGERILFLGGVAFNESVVAAFQHILGKPVTVPEHHDVSAAIGMALIARDEYRISGRSESGFKGFLRSSPVHDTTSFACKDCANACRITRVTVDGNVAFYGGACGKHERNVASQAIRDPFREREALLMACLDSQAANDSRETIGIPRALLFYELFPLWAAFLQGLGYRVVVSSPTNKQIINDGLQRTPIDNCLACKVAYGHIEDLRNRGIRRVFFPSVVEFERKVKDLEHNYACPQVQCIPELLRQKGLELISPVFARDRGEDEWACELRKTAQELGHSPAAADSAIKAARRALADFRTSCETIGRQVLKEAGRDRPVAVMLGKAYNICDPALNLSLPAKLRHMGVIPLPFDCLPVSNEKLDETCCDMVWDGGQTILRAARIAARSPHVYPVWITNFGCGCDSFIGKYFAAQLHDKPMLALEVDEHTSDVGVITRLEAFLNVARDSGGSAQATTLSVLRPYIAGSLPRLRDRVFYLPRANANFLVLRAAFEACGFTARLLPTPGEETRRLGALHSSGRECLPYVMYLGDAVRMTMEPDFDPKRAAFFIPGSNMSCRMSAYPTAIRLVLSRLGFPDVPVFAPRTSMDKDEMTPALGMKFGLSLFRGATAVELLGKLLLETRPYEREPGSSDRACEQGVADICRAIVEGGIPDAVEAAVQRFDAITVDRSVGRPVVGMVGDEYTRCSAFVNNDFVRRIESYGIEVRNAGIWSNYLEFQRVMKPRTMKRRGRYISYLVDLMKSGMMKKQSALISRHFKGRLRYEDPDFYRMFSDTTRHFDERVEAIVHVGLAQVLSLVGSGVDGIASLGAFHCMPDAVVSARALSICRDHNNLPLLRLAFDFQEATHQENRIEAFAHQVKQRHANRSQATEAERRG